MGEGVELGGMGWERGLCEAEGEDGLGKAEGEAVVGCGAVLGDGGAVGFGGVAFVDGPAVLGIVGGETVHQFVAVSFGQNGGCGYRHEGGVAFHHCGVGNIVVWTEFIPVYEYVLGPN